MSTTTADQPVKTFFGQPRQLTTIFGVEMWERFSFYGMQGILLLYMFYPVAKGGLGIDIKVATGIVGAVVTLMGLLALPAMLPG